MRLLDVGPLCQLTPLSALRLLRWGSAQVTVSVTGAESDVGEKMISERS